MTVYDLIYIGAGISTGVNVFSWLRRDASSVEVDVCVAFVAALGWPLVVSGWIVWHAVRITMGSRP